MIRISRCSPILLGTSDTEGSTVLRPGVAVARFGPEYA